MFKGSGGMMIAVGLMFVAIAIAVFWRDAVNSFYFLSGVVMIVGGTIMNKLDEISLQLKEIKEKESVTENKTDAPH